MNRRDRESPDGHIMLGSDRNAAEQACDGCQQPLLLENAWMEDGCPCNTGPGVNNLNLYRWKLLHDLQQAQSHKLEAAQQLIEGLEKHNDINFRIYHAKVESLVVKIMRVIEEVCGK